MTQKTEVISAQWWESQTVYR